MKQNYPFQRTGIWKWLYMGAGIVAAVSLLLAAKGNQAWCMTGSTAGILCMYMVNMVLGYKSCKQKYFISRSFWKDTGMMLVWILLLLIWYSELTGRIHY